nr:MAG: capsid protein [Chemarfal virus 152]
MVLRYNRRKIIVLICRLCRRNIHSVLSWLRGNKKPMTIIIAEGNRFNQEGGLVADRDTQSPSHDLLTTNDSKLARERREANVRATLKEKKHQHALNAGIKESEQKALGVQDAMRELNDRPKVAHPWHLSRVPHRRVGGHVILDSKDGTQYVGIAKFADNLQGGGIIREEYGVGTVALPQTWADPTYVAMACDPLVGEALGKNDLDLRYLIPRAIQNLKSYCPPWSGVEKDISDYLLSDGFLAKVIAYQCRRNRLSRQVLVAKLLREASGWNPSLSLCEKAVDVHLRTQRGEQIFPSGIWIVVVTVLLLLWFFPGPVTLLLALFAFGYICWEMYESRQYRMLLALLQDKPVIVRYASAVSIAATCSRGIVLPPLLDNWKTSIESGNQDLACKVKQCYNVFGTHISGSSMVVPNGCHHDQYNGLRIRFLFSRLVDRRSVTSLIDDFKNWSLQLKHGRWVLYSYDEWVLHLPGKRGSLLLSEPYSHNLRSQVPVDIFVKLEAYMGKTPGDFKPRIIQGRRLGYQNLVGPFFYSVSKWLATVFDGSDGLHYDAGIDAVELGSIATRFFGQKKNVFEIDVSNWDGSLVPELLQFEIWFIENCVPDTLDRWTELKKHWCNVSGVGSHGVRYSTTHGRRSGDMWTSCFNSLINLLILRHIFGEDLLAVAKGDDNFFGTNSELTVEEIQSRYANFGMKAKVKKRDSIDQLEYCSGKFWPIEGGYKWGVKPFRIIGKLGLNLHRHHTKKHFSLLYGTAISMLPIAGHVPFIGTLLRTIVNIGSRANVCADMSEADNPYRQNSTRVDEIHDLSYELVKQTYSLSNLDILAMESSLSQKVGGDQLTPEDFPLVFDDHRFLRGFNVDCDCETIVSPHIRVAHSNAGFVPGRSTQVSLPPVRDMLALWVAPVLEESVRHIFPYYVTALLAGLETLYYGVVNNFIFHLSMLGITLLGVPLSVRIFVHFLYNLRLFYAGRKGIDYASICSVATTCWSSLALTGAGLFNPMPNCLALFKYRIMGNGHALSTMMAVIVAFIKQSANKKNNTKNKTRKTGRGAPKKKDKGSLGRSLLKGGLGALGGLLGPTGASVGASLGDWGANILGMGDYEVKNNTILEGNGVARMHATRRGVTISHREFLGDITGSVGFSNRTYVINPGSPSTFPWLSNVAAMFQQYRIKGMIFEFNSTSADALNSVNTALGSVIMSTQYNVAMTDFVNKAEMEQYEYTVSGRPSRNLIHCIECDPSLQVMDHLFTRTGVLPVGQDYQFYDWGKFQLATIGMQAASTIGELWVSYDIEFLKPRIASGGAWPGDFTRINNGPYTGASNVLGDIQVNPVGTLGVTIAAGASGWQRVFFPSTISAGRFRVTIHWRGTVAAAYASPARTLSNLTASNYFLVGVSAHEVIGPSAGANTTDVVFTGCYTVNGYSTNGSWIEFGTGGTLPATASAVTIEVVALPLADSAF